MYRVGVRRSICALTGLFLMGLAQAASAAVKLEPQQVPLVLDSAATAWMLTATALVLLMTVPGLALFYGGLVRRKNLIGTYIQSVAVAAVVTVVWFCCSYSLSFGVGGPIGPYSGAQVNSFIGSLDAAFLKGVTPTTAYSGYKGIPEILFVAYQMTFAIITPALITGAFAERVKFSGLLLFTVLWSIFVYAPIAHWVWGGGFLGAKGILDFAGGSVVHINSGVAGLVAALFIGKRKGYPAETFTANSPVLSAIGVGLLLVGWIGFNAGSEVAADGIAAQALFNTVFAAFVAGLGWMLFEWVFRKKPSLEGIGAGIVAGLVGITPAAGFVDSSGAFFIGLLCGPLCFIGSNALKKVFGYDDSLDAFGVHGVGGILGAILTGVFATTAINPLSSTANVTTQLIGVGSTILWSGCITFVILIIVKFTTGLRVKPEDEIIGLDAALHGEAEA